MKRFKQLTHFLLEHKARIFGVALAVSLVVAVVVSSMGILSQTPSAKKSQVTVASTSADSCTESNSYFNHYLDSIDFTQCPSNASISGSRSEQTPADSSSTPLLGFSGVSRRVQSDRKWSCTPASEDVYISKECIQTSMMRRGPLSNANYYSCRDGDDRQPRVVAPPCVTPHFIQYMFNETNKALACVNSGTASQRQSNEQQSNEQQEERLTPHEVFGMLNRESVFMPNISYIGGIGVAQLVKHGAAQDFYTGPTSHLWSEIKSNPECAAFSTDHPQLLNDPKLVASAAAGHINTCSLLNIEDNPDRSLILGLTAYRSFKRQILNRLLRKDKAKMAIEEYKSLNEKLTQDAYNAGLGRVFKAYGSIQDTPRVRHRMAAFSKTFQLGTFKQEMARQYMKATNQTQLPVEAAQIIDWIFLNLTYNYDKTDAWAQSNLLLDRESVAKIMRTLRVDKSNPGKQSFLNAGKVIYNIVKTAPASFFTYSDAIDKDLMKISKGKTQCELAGSP